MRNWVYYMQEGLKSMWKKKVVPDYRKAEKEGDTIAKALGHMDVDGNYITNVEYGHDQGGSYELKKYKTITDEVKFNSEGVVHKNHPFTDREFDGAFQECGCLPDCGCKE